MGSGQERKKVRATSSVVPTHIDVDGIGLDDIQAFDAFCARYPDIAGEARLRWWIYHRRSNGLQASGAIVKRAGRWFVVVPRLKAWLLADSAQAA